MNTLPIPDAASTSYAAQAAATRQDVLEQVMRLTEDDLVMLSFLTVEPGTAAAAAALGRLLSTTPVRLVDGCPLVSFTTGRPVDARWRDWYPCRDGSLWALLVFYRQMYGHAPAADVLAELEDLRVRAASDLPTF